MGPSLTRGVLAPKVGAAVQVIGRSFKGVHGVAVAEKALYWEDRQNPDGAIIQRTDLKTWETALFHSSGTGDLLAVGTDLWFRSPSMGRFMRAPLDGGTPRHHRAPNYDPALASDGAHFYGAHEQVTRINLATGVEELVADLPVPTWCSALAVTREWVFVSPNNALYRIAKPAP